MHRDRKSCTASICSNTIIRKLERIQSHAWHCSINLITEYCQLVTNVSERGQLLKVFSGQMYRVASDVRGVKMGGLKHKYVPSVQ